MAEHILFDGQQLNGTVLEFPTQSPRPQARLVKHWGLEGEVELRGKGGGREIAIRMLVHGQFLTYPALVNVLKQWERIASAHNRNGRLMIRNTVNGVTEPFNHCTLVGFERLAGEGAGPALDVSGTLDPVNHLPSWYQMVLLRFYQLRVSI